MTNSHRPYHQIRYRERLYGRPLAEVIADYAEAGYGFAFVARCLALRPRELARIVEALGVTWRWEGL